MHMVLNFQVHLTLPWVVCEIELVFLRADSQDRPGKNKLHELRGVKFFLMIFRQIW